MRSYPSPFRAIRISDYRIITKGLGFLFKEPYTPMAGHPMLEEGSRIFEKEQE